MDGRRRVLLADASPESCTLLREAMEQTGVFRVDTACDGETVLEQAAAEVPDLLVMDVLLPGLDGLSVLRALQERGIAPLTIFISGFVSDQIAAEAAALGAAYFLPKPFHLDTLLERMELLFTEQPREATPSLKWRVTRVLHTLGMPADLAGYHYLRAAILLAVEDRSLSTTKVLYPGVARRFRTTASRVERCIRSAIETAWDRAASETLRAYFGETVSAARGKPTNSEFIALVADRLALEDEESSDP